MHIATQASEKPCSIAMVQKSPTFGFGNVFLASLVYHDFQEIYRGIQKIRFEEAKKKIHKINLHISRVKTSVLKSLQFIAHCPAKFCVSATTRNKEKMKPANQQIEEDISEYNFFYSLKMRDVKCLIANKRLEYLNICFNFFPKFSIRKNFSSRRFHPCQWHGFLFHKKTKSTHPCTASSI